MDEQIRRLVSHWLLAAGMVLMPLGVADAASVRVALVGTHDGGVAGGVVALAEAQLSSRDGLEVLDRQHVDRVLKEQKLSVSGLVDAGWAIKAGQLLSADLFALVEQSTDGKETLACIVYDTKAGLRLCDTTLSGDGIEVVSGEVVTCVERATQKRAAGIANVKTLSLVGVRNADLPRSLDTTCESLGLLLERELARSGDVALLERKRLGWLQQERTLTATETDRKLLSSALQADLQFARQADGVRATVIVTDAAGQRIHTATADAKQLDATLVAPLVEALLRGLNAKPTVTPSNGLRESQRFFREAEQRWSFKEPTLAIQAAEAALLLDPRNADKMLLLAEYLLQSSTPSFRLRNNSRPPGAPLTGAEPVGDGPAVVLTAQRGIELYEVAYRQIDPRDMDGLAAVENRTRALDRALLDLFIGLPRNERVAGDPSGKPSELYGDLARAAWQVLREHVSRWHGLTKKNPRASFAYSRAVFQALMQLERQKFVAEETSPRASELLNEWLSCFETLPDQQQPYVYINTVLRYVTSGEDFSPFDPVALEPFVVRLEHHSMPLFQLHGRRARLNHNWDRGTVTLTERVAGLRPLRVDVFTQLDRPENKSDSNVRRAYYAFLTDTYPQRWQFRESPEYEAECAAISEAMLARRELMPRLCLLGMTGSDKQEPDIARRALARIDAALTLVRSANVTLVDNSDIPSARKTLEAARSQFLVRHRGLVSDKDSLRVRTRLLLEYPPPGGRPVLTTSLDLPRIHAPKVTGENAVGVVMTMRAGSKAGQQVAWLQGVLIPLDSGIPTMLGEVATSLRLISSGFIMTAVTASCVHDGRFYVVVGEELAEFDLKTPTARIVETSQKLPATKIQSLASFDGRLWLGMEGGYLISLAPRADDVRVLVSSRRKEKLSPLDDREAFATTGIVPDPGRERLLFLIRFIQDGKQEPGEFWEYRPKTQAFRRLLEFSLSRQDHWAISAISEDRLVISSFIWMVTYDLTTDRPFVVGNYPLGPLLPLNRQQHIRQFLQQPVMCADRLWSAQGQSLEGKLTALRLDAGDDRVIPVDLPPLDKDEIYAGWYVAPIDNKRFLWSNHHRLWLVTPEGGEMKPPVAKQ